MKRLVSFPLEDGSSVTVEVDEPETGGTVRAARGDTVEKAKETLETALDKVLPMAKSVVGKLRAMDGAPDEFEVKFGVKLTSKADAIIASAAAEANFEVNLHWTRAADGRPDQKGK
ncbi:MAG: CU044_2847 family protein [Ktedonobacteraceae bacterium]